MSTRGEFRYSMCEPWQSMPVTEFVERLQAIADAHHDWPGNRLCAICDAPWPCLTWMLAAGSYPPPERAA